MFTAEYRKAAKKAGIEEPITTRCMRKKCGRVHTAGQPWGDFTLRAKREAGTFVEVIEPRGHACHECDAACWLGGWEELGPRDDVLKLTNEEPATEQSFAESVKRLKTRDDGIPQILPFFPEDVSKTKVTNARAVVVKRGIDALKTANGFSKSVTRHCHDSLEVRT